jgi:outer membrane protein OmpU
MYGKTAASVAIAATCACAHAQSSVTLYGLIDAGVSHVSNEGGKSNTKLDTGIQQANRFGMRGVEDLGGGTKAIFTLENGFALDTGTSLQGGALFGRQAFVGLSGGWGTLTMGRQYDYMNDNLVWFNSGAMTSGAQAFHLGNYDRLGGERLNNSVKYTSPAFGGVNVGAAYSFGENPGTLSKGSSYSAGAAYREGPLRIGTAYTRVNDGALTPAAIGLGTLFGLPTAGPGGNTTFALDHQATLGVGASYAFGPITPHALYTQTTFRSGTASATLRAYELGITYWASTALAFGLGDTFYTMGDTRWNAVSAAADYFLSKRTDVYTSFNYLHTNDASVKATMFLLAPSSSQTQAVLRVGIRHKF